MRQTALVIALAIFAAAASAQADSPAGAEEYQQYCSACHGARAEGNGPVANVLDPPPPSLKALHQKYGKPLGTSLVAYVMGTTMPRAHGTSDMPVWGRNLASDDGDDAEAIQTIWRIVNFLEAIQTEPN